MTKQRAWLIVLPAAPATGVELTVIAYTGGDAPGTSTQFESILSNGEFDASGRVAFRARLVGPELRRGGDGATLALVARSGDTAPGIVGGVFGES